MELRENDLYTLQGYTGTQLAIYKQQKGPLHLHETFILDLWASKTEKVDFCFNTVYTYTHPIFSGWSGCVSFFSRDDTG